MTRGKTLSDGTERIAPNGYAYRKVDGKWRLLHHIIAEETLGRSIDTKKERVSFKDNDRTNLKPDNILVSPKASKSNATRRAYLETKIEELQAELEGLQD